RDPGPYDEGTRGQSGPRRLGVVALDTKSANGVAVGGRRAPATGESIRIEIPPASSESPESRALRVTPGNHGPATAAPLQPAHAVVTDAYTCHGGERRDGCGRLALRVRLPRALPGNR